MRQGKSWLSRYERATRCPTPGGDRDGYPRGSADRKLFNGQSRSRAETEAAEAIGRLEGTVLHPEIQYKKPHFQHNFPEIKYKKPHSWYKLKVWFLVLDFGVMPSLRAVRY
eukprot:1303764-Rhodomonas_salina.3